MSSLNFVTSFSSFINPTNDDRFISTLKTGSAVITANGKPLSKVNVELEPEEQALNQEGNTKTAGLYEIEGVVPGTYAATITSKDYQTLTTEVSIAQGQKLLQNFVMVKV